MGLKIKAKFGSSCDKCKKTWHEGDEIYWDKSLGSATCSDLECYKSKNGSAIEFPSGNKGGGYYKIPITEAPKFLDTTLMLCDTILKKIDGTLEPKERLVLVESIFKTVSQSYKGE